MFIGGNRSAPAVPPRVISPFKNQHVNPGFVNSPSIQDKLMSAIQSSQPSPTQQELHEQITQKLPPKARDSPAQANLERATPNYQRSSLDSPAQSSLERTTPQSRLPELTQYQPSSMQPHSNRSTPTYQTSNKNIALAHQEDTDSITTVDHSSTTDDVFMPSPMPELEVTHSSSLTRGSNQRAHADTTQANNLDLLQDL